MAIQDKRLAFILLAVAVVLLLPLIAMQFTPEVNWQLTDFVMAGVLLLSAGLLCAFVLRRVPRAGYRIALCSLVLIALVLAWAELAVGIFGTPFAGT